MTPEDIYKQSTDKQRVVVTGNGAVFIIKLVQYILNQYNRKIDYVIEGQELVISKDAPTIIIQAQSQLRDYNHHIAVLSELTSNESKENCEKFVDATPKGGTLIYTESDLKVKAIGSKQATDLQAIPYKAYKHETQNGQAYIVSSTNAKVLIQHSSELELQYVSAAKELLKKLGITSGQFYKAVGSFKLN